MILLQIKVIPILLNEGGGVPPPYYDFAFKAEMVRQVPSPPVH